MDAARLHRQYETKVAKQVKMQMMRDSSAEQIVQRHKQQLAQRKINYGQHVKELYMPDTSTKKVRQSELMLRNEFNPHIKIRGRKLSLSHGGARSQLDKYS